MTKLLLALLVKIPLPKLSMFVLTIVIAWGSSIFHSYVLVDRVLTALLLYYAGKLLYPHLGKLIDNKILAFIGVFCILYLWQYSFPYTMVETSVGMNGVYYPIYLLMSFLAFFPCLYVSKK